MKYLSLLLLFCIYSSISFGQNVKIGSIDIYGNRKIDSSIVYKELGLKVGDSIDVDFKRNEGEKKLIHIPGVKHATLNFACCDIHSNTLIYIGIGETDECLIKHRVPPTENIRLPGEIITTYNNMMDQLEVAVNTGHATEDDKQGYAFLNYAPARALQEKFIGFTSNSMPQLINVLKNSRYSSERAAAADVIAYSNDRLLVRDNLLYAVDDDDEAVRNNATRAIGILASYLLLHPELKMTIPADPFIKLVNSIVWVDRNKGSMALGILTHGSDKKILAEIKQQSLPSIIEMAKWKNKLHAYFPFVILGRLAGIDDKVIFADFDSSDRIKKVELYAKKCLTVN